MLCDSTADVIVVGLGAVGSATLLRLAELGVRAVGVDRHHPPHTFGSSHGESRITRLAVGEGDAYAPLVKRSHALWRELEAEAGADLLLQTGGLVLAPRGGAARHHGKDDFVRRSEAIARRFGIAHEILDADGVAARFPQFGLRGDEVAYYEPTAGLLYPERCVEVQLRLARERGAKTRFDETVHEVRQEGNGVCVTTDRGTLAAARAVVTAGPWLPELLHRALGGVTRVYRQTLHWFEPMDASSYAPDRFPVFIWMHGEGEEDYMYGFPTLPGTGAVKVASERYASTTSPDAVERLVAPSETAEMYARHVAGRLHGLTSRSPRSAACLYTVTPDGGFIVDNLPDEPRVLLVSACSGHGFKHSAALGEAVAQHLSQGESTIDLTPFSLARFGSRGDSAS